MAFLAGGLQTFCNPIHRVALQVFPVDALYHLRLLWIEDEIPICILGVAEEVIAIPAALGKP